jgi:hypothetical protein
MVPFVEKCLVVRGHISWRLLTCFVSSVDVFRAICLSTCFVPFVDMFCAICVTFVALFDHNFLILHPHQVLQLSDTQGRELQWGVCYNCPRYLALLSRSGGIEIDVVSLKVTLRISDFAVYYNISNVFNENSHKYAYKRYTQLFSI